MNQKELDDKIEKLTKEEYKIIREAGTDTPFQNKYNDNYEDGIYVDILTGIPLFSSKDKYHSNTGWPSFVKPIDENNIITKVDNKFNMNRIEVIAKDSKNHLGHVFDDGPIRKDNIDKVEPTGLRYCLNSTSLKFIPKNELLGTIYEKYLKLFT